MYWMGEHVRIREWKAWLTLNFENCSYIFIVLIGRHSVHPRTSWSTSMWFLPVNKAKVERPKARAYVHINKPSKLLSSHYAFCKYDFIQKILFTISIMSALKWDTICSQWIHCFVSESTEWETGMYWYVLTHENHVCSESVTKS